MVCKLLPPKYSPKYSGIENWSRGTLRGIGGRGSRALEMGWCFPCRNGLVIVQAWPPVLSQASFCSSTFCCELKLCQALTRNSVFLASRTNGCTSFLYRLLSWVFCYNNRKQTNTEIHLWPSWTLSLLLLVVEVEKPSPFPGTLLTLCLSQPALPV